MEKFFIVIRHTQSLYRDYYGPFENKDDAWDWINKTDRYRVSTWTVQHVEDVST